MNIFKTATIILLMSGANDSISHAISPQNEAEKSENFHLTTSQSIDSKKDEIKSEKDQKKQALHAKEQKINETNEKKLLICKIDLGCTTIDDLEGKCRIIQKQRMPNGWAILSFDPVDFQSPDFPVESIDVFCANDGLIHKLVVKLPLKSFEKVKSEYTKKYFLLAEGPSDNGNFVLYSYANFGIRLDKTERHFVAQFGDAASNEFIKSLKMTDNSETTRKLQEYDNLPDGIDDLKPLGLTIDSTDEAEISEIYDIPLERDASAVMHGGSQFDELKNFKMLFLNPAYFVPPKDLRGACIIVGREDNTVKAIELYYPQAKFAEISKRLSEQYTVIAKNKEANAIKCEAGHIRIVAQIVGDQMLLAYDSDDWEEIQEQIKTQFEKKVAD